MQKVKEGYRASVRLNMNHSEQREVYKMFEAILQTGDYVNESDVFRDAIRKLYDFKFRKEQEQMAIKKCEQCADIVSGRVREVIEDILKDSSAAFGGESENLENAFARKGNKPPEETQELPSGLCDFMNLL